MRNEVNVTASKFPFIMILAAMLFRGFLFSILNGPLIWNLLCKNSFETLDELYKSGTIDVLAGILKLGGGAFSVSILIITCMSIGIVLNPIENLLSTLIPTTINLAIKTIKWAIKKLSLVIKKPLRFTQKEFTLIFTQKEFMNKEYAPFLSWLMMNPTKKTHWEWELFLYQLSWSIFTIISVWSILSLILLKQPPSISIGILIPYFVVTSFFLIFALSRGYVLSNVHLFYFKQYKDDETVKKTLL